MDWRDDLEHVGIPLPSTVVASRVLTPIMMAAWTEFWELSKLGTRHVRAGRASLAQRLRASESACHRALKQLEKLKLIELIEQPKKQERLWRVTTPDEWT